MTQNRSKNTVAGVVAPGPRLTPYALFLIASALSLCLAVPLWAIEWWL